MTPDKTPTDKDLWAAIERYAGAVAGRQAGCINEDAVKPVRAALSDVLAKWGSPVVAGDVDRADAVNLARNALTQYDCAITKKGVRVLAEAVLSMDSALTTPQPTQAQAGAVDDDRERLFWEACQPHGKVGEVVYLTYKSKRDAAIAAKGV